MLPACSVHAKLSCALHAEWLYFPTACLATSRRTLAGVYDDLFQRLAKAEEKAHEERDDRKGKRPPGPFPRFGALGCAGRGVRLQAWLQDAAWARVLWGLPSHERCQTSERSMVCHAHTLVPAACTAGLSDADWPSVSAFYAYWGSFGSVKDFAWADQYHTGQAPNRKVGGGSLWVVLAGIDATVAKQLNKLLVG